MVNDASAYIRGLAQMRGRNAKWAERAVREAVSLSATEAEKMNVIDFIADSVPALLEEARRPQGEGGRRRAHARSRRRQDRRASSSAGAPGCSA